MKKVLSVVLCLLVLISSVTTVLFSGVSANAEGSVFDNPDNWKRYAFNTTYVNDSNGTPADWGSVKKNVNAAYTFNGDASSIAISAKLQLSTVEFDVKANTDYELTYRFLASGAKYNSNGVDTYLVRTGIVTPDGSISWGQDGYLLYIDTVKAYSAPNGVFANRTSITTRTADWSEEGVWQEVALKFNSGNNTKLKLVVQAGADTVYVDDFFLAEKYDFESLSNWGIYNPNAVANDANYLPTATYGDGDNQLKMSWCNISTSTAEDSDSTGKSIKIYGNAFNVAANLPTLKANTKYTLSFKYKPGTTTVVAASNGAYFTSHIIKKGAEFNQWNSGPKEFVSDLGKGTETSDWKEISVDFTTDDTTDYMLEFRFGFAAGFECFVDGFKLTEKERPTYFIQDFEDYTKSKSEYVGALSVVTPVGTSVSGTKALFYDSTVTGASSNEGDNRVILNPANSGLPTLTEIVNKGSNFRITAKYKLLEGEVKFYMQGVTDGTSAWTQLSANPFSYKSTTLSAGDSWQEFSFDFTLKADADDNAAKYPTFFIGGAGKAYFDYITVSTLTANVPNVAIPEETPTEVDPFEALENWGIYVPNPAQTAVNDGYVATNTYDGETRQTKMGWCTITNDTSEYADDKGKSVKINGNAFNVAANLPTLKANTEYTLNFKYKPGSNTVVAGSNNCYFTSHIIKKGVGFNQWNAGPETYVATLPNGTQTTDWKEVSVTFTTDDTTDYMLEFRFGFGGGYVLFLDEFTLTENQVTPDPDPTPTPVDGDYDNAENWKLYHADYAPTVNNNGVTENGWIKNTQNTDKAYTYNNGEKSVKFYGNTQYTAVKLTNLEKGKAYKVKFMYFAPASSTVGANSKAWVNNIGILKGGTAMNANAPVEYFKKGAVFAGEAGKWHEYSINFRAETTDMYFGMGLTFASGYTLYIDDFTVTETDEDPDAPPVVPGKEPREEWVIDFETDAAGKNATLSPRDRIEIVNAEGYDGKKSNMLHFKKGAYESATTLNYSTTFATDTDAVFTMGVKPQKVYKLSFRVKANSQTLPDGATKGEWIGVYACFGKQNIVSSYQHSAKRAEWLYYEYNITTTAEQNLLSLYVNAGEYTPDMWIDDIKLVETDFEPFLGWGSEPKDEILINFDDFYVGYDIACASIKDAPARDGKVSKATYLKGGDYNYNVVANYSAVTQYRDPVFTVPCKPETLYEFSYYIYVPKNTGSLGYFAVYYDWANTWLLRASGMPERDQWVKKSVRFTTKAGQTQLSFTFNGGKVIPDIYLDDILLKELKPGTLNLSSDASYSEAPYNVFENEKLTSKVTANKTTVIKLPVKKQFQYTFGITVESLKKSNSRIFLSFDGVNPMPLSDVTAPFSVITSDGVGGRFGIDFISDTSGYVYLVIENDDGALKLSDPYLFNTNSISANLPMGKAEKPEVGTLSVNANKGHLEKLVVFGSTEEEALIGDSPATGSRSVAPVLLLFFTTLISCVLLLKSKKGGEQA